MELGILNCPNSNCTNKPAAGTPEGRAAAGGGVPDHGSEALQADGPRAGRRAVDARLVSLITYFYKEESIINYFNC